MAATIALNIEFEGRKGDPNKGNIVLTFTEDTGAGGTSVAYKFRVTDPSGTVIKALPTSGFDGTLGPSASIEETVEIPLDSNGNYLGGSYIFYLEYSDLVAATSNPAITKTIAFDPKCNPENTSGHTTFEADLVCATGVLTATDTSDYTDVDLIAREIRIEAPPIDQQADVVNTTTASADMTVAYTNTVYDAFMEVSFSWDDIAADADLISSICYGSVTHYVAVNVECEAGGVCATASCFAEFMDKVYAELCGSGGYNAMSATTSKKLLYAIGNLFTAKLKQDCGDYSGAEIYLARAKETVNCGCGCSDSTDTPIAFTPPIT